VPPDGYGPTQDAYLAAPDVFADHLVDLRPLGDAVRDLDGTLLRPAAGSPLARSRTGRRAHRRAAQARRHAVDRTAGLVACHLAVPSVVHNGASS